MKRLFQISAIVLAMAGTMAVNAKSLVLLTTNDTHSQIDPDSDNLGGVLRRKVIVDSVRQANPNVLLIDAGDAVQGTLYFTLYKGEVETKAMNLLGYDLAVMGNHDFDNGIEELAANLRNSNSTWLTTNYDLRNTPLDSMFLPYVIKLFDGKRIAFMGINLKPDGMISARNCPGVEFLDIYKAANSTAWHLKHNERADMVVAITHIGYADQDLPDDIKLARSSEDIDIIIGGHTHTAIDPTNPVSPAWLIPNAVGRDVLVTQNGKMGKTVGEIVIDLDSLTPTYSLIRVDSRLDNRLDPAAVAALEPYRAGVDSLLNVKVARTAQELDQQRLANLFGDIVKERGKELVGKDVDFGLVNNGGVRNKFPKGIVSEGNVLMTLPFDNRVEVIRVKGSDLAKVFDKMTERGINGVSSNVSAIYDVLTHHCNEILIDGNPLDPDRYYTVATLDYLANGGDYLVWLRDGEKLAESPQRLAYDVIAALKRTKKPLNPTMTPRIRPASRND